jgi:hypothetical protein
MRPAQTPEIIYHRNRLINGNAARNRAPRLIKYRAGKSSVPKLRENTSNRHNHNIALHKFVSRRCLVARTERVN